MEPPLIVKVVMTVGSLQDPLVSLTQLVPQVPFLKDHQQITVLLVTLLVPYVLLPLQYVKHVLTGGSLTHPVLALLHVHQAKQNRVPQLTLVRPVILPVPPATTSEIITV